MRVIWKLSRAHSEYPKEIDSEGIEFDFRGRVAGQGCRGRRRKGKSAVAEKGKRRTQRVTRTALSNNTECPRR